MAGDLLPKKLLSLSLHEIIAEIALAKHRDSEIDAEIDELLAQKAALEKRVYSLQGCTSDVINLQHSSQDIAGNIEETTFTAQSISSKVRDLDTAQSRLNEALSRVETILDLKNSIENVELAVQSEDYSKAASILHRVLNKNESEDVRAADEMSYEILLDLESQTQEIVVEQCKKALFQESFDEVQKLTLLYPMLSMGFTGLAVHCHVLRQKFRRELEKNGMTLQSQPEGAIVPFFELVRSFADSATRFVASHRRALISSFGARGPLRLVQELQEEADLMLATVVDRFIRDRQIRLMLKQIDRFRANQLRQVHEESGVQPQESQEVDTLKLDELLQEISVICQEIELFDLDIRTLAKGAADSDDKLVTDRESGADLAASAHQNIDTNRFGEDLREGGRLRVVVQDLIGLYIALEEFCMTENVNKALRMNSYPEDSSTCTMVDDVFFILKQSTERSFSTFSVNGACAVVNNVNSLLCTVYRRKLFEELREHPGQQDPQSFSNMFQASQKHDDHFKLHVLLNSFDLSSEHMLTLKKQLEERFEEAFSGTSEKQLAMIRPCLDTFVETSEEFHRECEQAVSRYVALVVPSLRITLEAFANVNYELTEDGFADQEASEPLTYQLILETQNQLEPLKESLSPRNFDAFVHGIVDYLVQRLESIIFKLVFSFWGGLQFDRDLRALVGFFSGICERSIRDKFSRLNQFSSILQVEKISEISDYWTDSASVWRLDIAEVKRVLALRSDLSKRSVQQLRL
eukprot:19962_1